MLKGRVEQMIQNYGDNFTVERNGTVIKEIKGSFSGKEYPNCIQVSSDADISENDWLIHNSSQIRYFVENIHPVSHSNTILSWRVKYLSELEYKKSIEEKDTATFSIGTVYGSAVVGNYNTATINNGYNLDEVRTLIESKPVSDQEELNKLIDRLEIITEDNQPVSKGTLSKFSDLLSKHSDVAIAIGGPLIKWLIGK